MKNTTPTIAAALLACTSPLHAAPAAKGGDSYYTGEQVYSLQPNPKNHKEMGHIGPTGILAFVEVGVKVTIEGTRPGSPAEGKVEAGEMILGVNGQPLKGLNPYEVLGKAITRAEASDGKLVFDLESKSGPRQVTLTIPVLGAWGANWPVDCPKSEQIITRAAAYYRKHVTESKDMGIPTALPCLFLLSTGDDAHLPVVKSHIQKFIDQPNSIGDHTWNNGYNGILFAEYYLRTGDKDVLPLLQAICDDAKERQNFNSAWKHWGSDINPGYVAAAMIFTAPRKALRILGAPRSPHAKAFELPATLWGNEADLAFHRIEPAADYGKFGTELPMHRIFNLIGTAYSGGKVAEDPNSITLDQLQRLVRHRSYKVRAQAAKALRIKGELKALEDLLGDPDPRLRRAALDGINDWRYFFAQGKETLPAEKFTPGMIEAITAILNNPKESTYVVEGTLFAISLMPVEAIGSQVDAILPWTRHTDWWLRHASFTALQGLERDTARYAKVVPTLVEVMVKEGHTMPRSSMNSALARSLKKFGPNSDIGKELAKGFGTAVAETEVLAGARAREGKYNLNHAIWQAVQMAPETAPQLITLQAERGLQKLDDDELMDMILGTPSQQERTWHYLSFEPTTEKDILPKREGRRYRQVTLPAGTENWFMPEFDASGWQSGQAPIGKGGHPRAPKNLEHRSPWGDGEILLARTTFELDAADYDLYRLRTICIQGFDVYLNGKKIQDYSWWADPTDNRKWPIGKKDAALLKMGNNTLAVYTTLVYPSSQKPHWKDEVFGHLNVYIEGLRKEDLY